MNIVAVSCWLIISGLKTLLSSPSTAAINQLTVSLANHALTALASLTRDLGADKDIDTAPATLDLTK